MIFVKNTLSLLLLTTIVVSCSKSDSSGVPQYKTFGQKVDEALASPLCETSIVKNNQISCQVRLMHTYEKVSENVYKVK